MKAAELAPSSTKSTRSTTKSSSKYGIQTHLLIILYADWLQIITLKLNTLCVTLNREHFECTILYLLKNYRVKYFDSNEPSFRYNTFWNAYCGLLFFSEYDRFYNNSFRITFMHRPTATIVHHKIDSCFLKS